LSVGTQKVHTHALYEAGEKEAEDAIVWAKRHLFLANNLFSVYTYLREKRQDVQDELEHQGGGAGDGASSGLATVCTVFPGLVNAQVTLCSIQ
jgi:hypothetical protein